MAQAEPIRAQTYDSDDLAFFDNVLDNLVEELAASGESSAMNGSRDALGDNSDQSCSSARAQASAIMSP